MKAVVLTYHSHHVLAPNYAENDHLALPVDLATITAAGWRIVPLGADCRCAGRGEGRRAAWRARLPNRCCRADLRRRAGLRPRRLRSSGAGFPARIPRGDARLRRDHRRPTAAGAVGNELRDRLARGAQGRRVDLRPAVHLSRARCARRRVVEPGDRQRPARHRQPQLGSPAPGAAPGRALGGCARRFHAGGERRRCRRSDPRGRRLPARAHRRPRRSLLRLSVRALERVPRGRLPAAPPRDRSTCAPRSPPSRGPSAPTTASIRLRATSAASTGSIRTSWRRS